MKQLPHEWSYRSLGDIAAIVRGSSPRPAGDPKFFNGDYLPWITVGDVTSTSSMYLERTQSFLTPAGAEHTRILEKDTLTTTRNSSLIFSQLQIQLGERNEQSKKGSGENRPPCAT